jgi:hypothetical protein
MVNHANNSKADMQGINANVMGPSVLTLNRELYKPAKPLQMAPQDMGNPILRRSYILLWHNYVPLVPILRVAEFTSDGLSQAYAVLQL